MTRPAVALPLPDPATLIGRHLACPVVHRSVRVTGEMIAADDSPFRGRLQAGVAIMLENVPVSYFDDKFAVMQRGHDEKGGEWQFAYAQQVPVLEERLARGGVVLDVGCGPALPYTKPVSTVVIGIEYSLPSIAENREVDLRVCASAAALPLAAASVDTIVCFYSIHHMTGSTVAESEALVEQVLREFARVLRPDGEVLIFEMAPVSGFDLFERLAWNTAKRLLNRKLDMYFWAEPSLRRLTAAIAPTAQLEIQYFAASPWLTFPAVFSLPWLRIPRLIYPLRPVLYRWRMPQTSKA